MKQHLLTNKQVLRGYDAVCALYSYVPPLSMWRAWEYAAYQNYQLRGRVLDLGCGDGRYFRLLWPKAKNVVGIDMDPVVADLGRQSGVYTEVCVTPAHDLPFEDASFDAVFANCSLEHMDRLDDVLAAVSRCLKPAGELICSVVTDKFTAWSLLPRLVREAGFDEAAAKLQKDFEDYHHLVNPLSVDQWKRCFEVAGMMVEEHVPILPKVTSGIFLLMDTLWHVKKPPEGEIGHLIPPFLSSVAKFPEAFREVYAGFLSMETEPQVCSGAVFKVRKAREAP